jgi:aryl-alcohol dehydrogenase-like predicted oxidoreductase
METRRLGRTNHASSVAVLGAAAFWSSTPEEAKAGFDLALSRGVNHLDIAPRYGAAESLIGPLVPAVREQLFVAGKTTRSNPEGVEAQFDDTRRLLGCEVLDLYQAHGVTSVSELDGREAAIGRILALRERGACRFAGITGHGLDAPATFLEAFARHDLDTVMFPVYPRLWADPDYRDAAETLLARCAERDIGVMAIKAGAWRPWSGEAERWATSWYEPQPDPERLARGIRFALSTPGVHAFCTPGDVAVLALSLDIADSCTPMTEAERAAVAAMAGEPAIFPMPV